MRHRMLPKIHSWGFLLASMNDAENELFAWRKRLNPLTIKRRLDGNLNTNFPLMYPTTLQITKEMLVETEGDWVAYFNNTASGGDPAPPVSYLCSALKCKGLIIQAVIREFDCVIDNRSVAVGFAFIDPAFDVNSEEQRSITYHNDTGRYIIEESGQPLWFENSTIYSGNALQFVDYLEKFSLALGIRLFDLDYYKGKCILLRSLYL